MRIYQIARELGRPHRAMLQLLRELGYEIPSHMARLTGEQETHLREAVERQERGAPAVRPVHTAAPSVSAARVAEVVGKVDIEEDKDWETTSKPRPAPTRPAARPRKDRPAAHSRRPSRARDEVLEQIAREAEIEGLEMVAEDHEDFIGPPLPPEGVVAETGVRTVDLAALEDRPAALPERPIRDRRSRRSNRGVRTLQRRRRTGPKVSIQATQNLSVTVPITVKELSQVFGVRVQLMLKNLLQQQGEFIFNMNSVLDEEQVKFLAETCDRDVTITSEKDAQERLDEELLEHAVAAEGDLVLRPPVVAVLGHVDHGKTSLLDKIRDSNVAEKEHGGITQHIGAFQVETGDGHKVTFLDTPGHAAFTAMRARGAHAADIVVLVVAADDGVMPQTEEAINHAKVAGVAIVVAVNKIDRPNANPTKVKQQLSAHGLLTEEWGGEVQSCDVSAMTGEGIPELVEKLALEAEVAELKANPKAPARGRVIEGRKDPHRGVVCTLLVEEGTLKDGHWIIAGPAVGRVRNMVDDHGKKVKAAGPSMPVEVFGLSEVPEAGDPFHAVKNASLARKVVDDRKRELRASTVKDRPQVTLATLFGEESNEDVKELKIILKADVRGSLEPLKSEIAKLEHAEVKLNLLYAGLGAVTKSDVDNAVAANAIIIGFHVLTEPAARKEAERKGVEVRRYMVIYEVIDDLKAAMENLLTPERREEVTGHAEIRRIFSSSKLGRLAGCMVIDGVIQRDGYIRLFRDGKLLYGGGDRDVQVDSMKRVKDDVKEVREGFECGLRIAAYQDIKEGDVIEFYALREVKRTLESKS